MDKYLNKEAFLKALTEAGRVLLIAVVPLLITMIGNGFEFDWKLILATALIAELKFIDKYIHVLGQELDSESLKKGLTRF